MRERRFIVLWAVGLLVCLLGWLAVFQLHLGVSTAGTREFAELIALKRRAAERAGALGPKLVVLGGSNVWYGVHARTVERITGVPAVNFGLNIGFGPKYLFQLARQAVRPGDTVVLSLENDEYLDKPVWEMSTFALAEDPGYYAAQPWPLRARWVLGCSWGEIAAALRARLHPATVEENFRLVRQSNAWGDMIENQAERETPKMRRQLLAYRPADYHRQIGDDSAGWGLIRDFHAWCAGHGVRLLVSYPPFPDDAPPGCQLDAWFARMTAFYEREGIPQLDTPWEMLHPRGDLYGSAYHLDWEHAEARSRTLAAELIAAGVAKKDGTR